MLTVDEYLQAICPNILGSPSKDVYVTIATSRTSSTFFGEEYNYAIALRASHIFTLADSRPDGNAGLITGQTEGRVTTNYWNEVSKGSHSDLHMTHYGKTLVALIHSRGPLAGVAWELDTEAIDVLQN